ncbi:zinc finger CCCH domain-containing protein 17 [Rosa rugosa]|uniref:zinc finger CCCH domain-containing protein 17 n=1 Tax=Rosa rugosa TaxID=74645 RepID=UPI002B4174D8|nr:zinc finger CCCH domain-containing protein 17 [Rosa rugosa]
MVVGAQPKPQPQSQPQPQQLQQQQQQPQPEASAEEEALKRNTDCVYFLASPVSCKKGSECEYRHSEHALYNPRDCWFWLNGNCLNLKCSFRHPPLDGLLGSPAASSAGPSLPLSHTATTPATNATFNSSKQAVPCIFFQRGFCSKADKCPFSHGPNPITSSKVPQTPAATHGTEPSSLKKIFGGIQKCTQEMKIPQVSASKIVGVPPQSKPAPKVETAPPRNGVGIERNVLVTRDFDDEALRYKARSVLPAMNGDSTGQANHFLQAHVSENHGFQNGKDVDEHLRESSPGFDVLVDDELGDSDYYHGEEQFGIKRGHDGRNLNSVNEYDLDCPTDYNSIADGDRERFRDPRGYDPYDQMQGRYAWDQHRASSERLLAGSAHSERRGYRKSDSPDHIGGSDLRHRLSKHRRGNGLRSIISNDYDGHVEERKSRPRRDSQQLPSHEGSLSSRLRGRIKLPGGSSPVNSSDLRQEREADRGRSRDRSRDGLSPRRPQIMSHQGRLRDRIQGRVQVDYNNEVRNFGVPRMRREIVDERSTEFSHPKRLSELKGGVDAEIREHSYLGKPNNVKMDNNQQSEGDLSFEGPKPLSEILKRKREAEAAAASGSRKRSSVNKQRNNEKEGPVRNPGGSETGAITMMHNSQSPVAKEETKSATTDAVGTENEKIDVAPGQSSEGHNDGELETEDGLIYDEALEDHELEGEDQREGEYDYEQGEDGEYTYEEGENADGEEEYLEEEDGDDFAKKIGVMFS